MTDLLGSFAPVLLPVLVLVLWTMVMMGWMAATRIPYMVKNNMGPENGERTSELGAMLPKEIQWKADNYNHLLEQPTAFYATALACAMAGLGDGLTLYMAWGYVVVRILHSLVHATVNNVNLRLLLFLVSSLCLIVMAGNGVIQLLN